MCFKEEDQRKNLNQFRIIKIQFDDFTDQLEMQQEIESILEIFIINVFLPQSQK